MTRPCVHAAALLALLALGACDVGDRCDPDQTLRSGVCFGPDAAPPADDAAPSTESPFGAVCVEHTDCVAPTSFCARQPADPTGYCTAVGCLDDATVCPAGWTCFDLSVIQAGLPAICTKP